MKKIIVFIITIIIIMSITVVSFAKIDELQRQNFLPEFNDYIGSWYGTSLENSAFSYTVIIARNKDVGVYYLFLSSFKSSSFEAETLVYNLTFDKDENVLYVTNDDGVIYKAKLINNQLVLYKDSYSSYKEMVKLDKAY